MDRRGLVVFVLFLRIRPLATLRALAAVAMAAVLVLTGCTGNGGDVVEVRNWTLETASGKSQLRLPSHFNDRLPVGPSSYTLRAEVPLPEAFRGRALTLTIAHLPALVALRVNGHEAVALDTSAFERYRSSGPHRWRVVAEYTQGPSIELQLVVDHTWVQSAWIDWIPTLSATPSGDTKFVLVTAFNEITAIGALVSMLLVSFLYGVIFLNDRSRKVHAWHAAQGILAATYPALLLGYLQPFFGTADISVAAMGITASAICSVFFIAQLFQLEPPSRSWWLFLVVVAGASVLSFGPFHTAMAVPPGVIVTIVAASTYGAVVFVRARRKGAVPLGSGVAALAFPITMVLGFPDAAALLGLGDVAWGLRGGSLAIGGLSMLQALALSRSHTASLKRTDHLNEQLQARVALLEENNQEIQVLNDELRRQVANRSQHLADALARLGPVFARPRPFASEEVIDGRYRVVRRIGEGGMGTVYEVERLVDKRRLALKVLQGHRSGAELARLAREAEIAARVDHPNVVAMFDVDVSASGAVFLVMEYVEGASLDALSGRYGDATWALGLLRQISDGLAVMHARDIVHRDLKPGNVLVTRGPSGGDLAKIADFGIATLGAASDETTAPQDAVADVTSDRTFEDARKENGATTDRNLTRTGQVLGTPLYMAPELARGAKNASPASDMYALGVMAFELLTGGVPSGYERLDHLRGGPPSAPSYAKRSPGVTPALASLLERCLASDPAARPTARELAEALSC